MMIEFDISTVFWISNLINDTVLCFLNIILIKKIISLSENSFIFFIIIKMFLISFTSQILSLLNFILIFVWFLAINITTSAQILFKISFRFSKHWNFDKIFIKFWQSFCCFNEKLPSIRFCSDQFCPYLALPHLTLPHLVPSHLIIYSILKSLIVPHHVKMHLILW